MILFIFFKKIKCISTEGFKNICMCNLWYEGIAIMYGSMWQLSIIPFVPIESSFLKSCNSLRIKHDNRLRQLLLVPAKIIHRIGYSIRSSVYRPAQSLAVDKNQGRGTFLREETMGFLKAFKLCYKLKSEEYSSSFMIF